MTTLTPGMVKNCNNDFLRWGGFRFIDEDVLHAMILKSERLVGILVADYANADGTWGLDTFDRGFLFDVFCETYTNLESWPCNMDGPETTEEMMESIRKLYQAGVIDIPAD